MLIDTITASIVVLNVSSISTWVRHLSDWGAECVGKAGCKDQFSKVKPATTMPKLKEASNYLHKSKRCGSKEMWWSIHKHFKIGSC